MVVAEHVAADRRVLRRRCRVVCRHRRRIGHAPVEALLHRPAMAIGGRDRHRVRTALRRRMVDRAGNHARRRVDRQAWWQARRGVGQRVAVNVGEMAGDIDRRDRLAVIVRLPRDRRGHHWRIVLRRDADRQRAGVRAALPVRHGVCRDRHRAVVIGHRREGVAAIRADRQRADARESRRAAGRHGLAANREGRHDKIVAVRVMVVARAHCRSPGYLPASWRYRSGRQLGGEVGHAPIEALLAVVPPWPSDAVTVTVYGPLTEAEWSIVPEITPVAGSIVRPGGNPVAV